MLFSIPRFLAVCKRFGVLFRHLKPVFYISGFFPGLLRLPARVLARGERKPPAVPGTTLGEIGLAALFATCRIGICLKLLEILPCEIFITMFGPVVVVCITFVASFLINRSEIEDDSGTLWLFISWDCIGRLCLLVGLS